MSDRHVLVLGTEHLVDWDGSRRPDIHSGRRQRELGELVDRLASWSPTKVGVEALASRQAAVDADFTSHCAGIDTDDRNETVQIGFRLAKAAGTTVHAVDADWALDWDGVERLLDRHPEAHPGEGLSADALQVLADLTGDVDELSLVELLLRWNRPPLLHLNDAEYLDRWAGVGAGDGWPGVDLVSSWLRRNVRIFANVQRATTPGDRMVVVIGFGHANALRHFFATSGQFELASVDEVLG